MEDNFERDLKENVNVPEQDFDKAMEDAATKFEQELSDANKDNPSPITDLEPHEEKETKLRQEIEKALKSKLDKMEPVEDVEDANKDKQDLPDLSDGQELTDDKQQEESKEMPDELIVEVQEEDKEKEEEEPNKEDSSVEKGYLNRLEQLHNLKMQMYREQVAKHEVNPNEQLFYKIIIMERQLVYQRSKYSIEEQEKFKEIEEKFKKEEMAEQKKVRDELKINVLNFDRLVTELKRLNEEIEYVEKLQFQSTERDSGKITEEDAAKRLQIANEKRTKLLAEIAILNPDLMVEKQNKKEEMETAARTIIGSGNIQEQNENLSDEIKKNIKYANSTDLKTKASLNMNDDYYKKELQRSKENHIYQFQKLEKELKELPEEPVSADDMAKKANILAQMKQVKSQIIQDEKLEKSMQDNMEKDNDEINEFIASDKELKEDFDKTEKGFKETDEYVEMIEKKEGEIFLDNPENTIEENKEEAIEDTIVTAGMAGYVMADKGHKIQAAIGCSLIASSLVRDVNNLEDANEYLNVVDKSEEQKEREEAQQELKGVESELRQ